MVFYVIKILIQMESKNIHKYVSQNAQFIIIEELKKKAERPLQFIREVVKVA